MKSKILIVKFLLFSLIILNCLGIICSASSDLNPSIGNADGWTLKWADEFIDPSINLSNWEFEVNAWGGGNNELQYYTNQVENADIENGSLVIKAIREKYTGQEGTREFTSARLRTKNKVDWKYGLIDVRAKLPAGKGIWPAIWMLPTHDVYGPWAASGEIDIMELKGDQPGVTYGTLHYGGAWPLNQHSGTSYTLPHGNFSDDYHTFSLKWEPTEITWYVDGLQYQSQQRWETKNGTYPAPFDQEFHLIVNIAVGGNFVGNPDNSTQFPQNMAIDYVRIFNKK